MREYITELSKYGMILLMALHVVCGFCALTDRLEKKRFPYVFQNLILFMIQLLMYADLVLVSKDLDYGFLYLFIQVCLLCIVTIVPVVYENCSRLLLNNMGMLLGIGLCVISRLSFNKAVKQYIIILVSLVIAMFIPWLMMRIRFFKKLTWCYALAGIVLLGAVFIFADVTHGSMLTMELWKISFQPSEFVKLIFIFFLAGAFWDSASLGRVAVTAVIAGTHVIILVMSRDLGSALIFFVVYVLVAVAATRNYLYLLAGAAGGSGAAVMAYRLFAHVRTRVLAWRDPWSYIDFQGYAITQSLFAIGSGNWFGMGLFKGNPGAIPYVEQDFAFSAVCEELGVAFGICALLLMLINFFAMMKMTIRIKDRFYQTIVYGIGIVYIFQIFLTVGGGIRLIPLTGVTLPFVSYGGSSVMVTIFMFFIVEGIYIRLQQEGGRQNGEKSEKRQLHSRFGNMDRGYGGSGDERTGGERPSGRRPEGAVGGRPEGNRAPGRRPEGSRAPGRRPEGAVGRRPEGNRPLGRRPEGAGGRRPGGAGAGRSGAEGDKTGGRYST